MTIANTINSLSNFTLSSDYRTATDHLFIQPTTNKNYSRTTLNYTITVPSDLSLKTTEIFNYQVTSSIRDDAKADVSNQALLGPLVLSGADVVADFSSHIRQTFSNYHQVKGTENPGILAALGFTTGFSLVSGGLNVNSAIKEIKTAEKISDTVGKTLANLKIARGVVQASGGAIFIPVRALSIAALFTSSKVISTIASVLGSVGSACFNVVSIIAAIGIGIRLNEQRQFQSELNAILQDPNLPEAEAPIKALEYLKKLAAVSPEEKEEIRQEIVAQPELGALNPELLSARIEEKAGLLLLKKEAYLKRLTNEDCVTQIREKGPSDAASVVEAVQKKSKEKAILASIGLALLTVGLVMTVASFIFTGPIGIIVSAAVGFATSLGWILVDGYDLIKEFKSTDPGRYDKLWIFMSTVVAVVSVSVVFFLSGGIAPIIAASVVGAVWLAINSACYYRLYKFEIAKSS
jgi:hypothetical protein